MMQFIRDHAQGLIVWTILGLIIITFALWGIGNYFQGASKVNVASVNGTDISENEFLNAFRQQQDRLRQALGKNYDPAVFNGPAMKRRVLDSLINSQVQNQLLQDAGFAAGKQLVDQEILSIGAFKDKGKYSEARVQRYLRSQGMSPEQFRSDIAHDIMVQQFRTGISKTAFVTPNELDNVVKLLLQRRDVGLLTVSAKHYEAGVKIEDKTVADYYDAHKKEFMTPEQVSVNYIELSQVAMAAGVSVSDGELRDYYKTHQSNFVKQPEQRRVRHILVKVDKDTDAAAAEKRAEALYREIQSGASFAEVARKDSQDTLSAKKGGDLGYLTKGEMGNAIDAAIFDLKKGQVSQPVRTKFGYQIFQVEDIKPAQVESFAEAKAQIKHNLQMQGAENDFYKKADELTNLTYEHPDSLDAAAQGLGLKIQHTDLFSRQGAKEGIASNKKFVDAAFGDQVLEARQNSDPVDLGNNRYAVLHVAEHKTAQQKPLDAVRGEIVQILRHQAAHKQAAAAAKAAAEKLRQGVAPDKVAASLPAAKWQHIGPIQRRANDRDSKARVPPAARSAAFRLPRPEKNKPTAKAVTLADGDAAAVVLFGVSQDHQSNDQKAAEQLRGNLAREMGSDDYEQLIGFERSQAKVKIHQAVLNAASEQ